MNQEGVHVPIDSVKERIALLLAEGNQKIPIIQISETSQTPCLLTITLLSFYRFDLLGFFQDMIGKWLYPGRKIPFETLYSCRLPHPKEAAITLLYMEGVIKIAEKRDLFFIQENLPLIKNEMELGMRSFYHARRILELKGFSNEEKLSCIQEELMKLVRRFPRLFDFDIFALLQRFMVSASDEYKKERSYKELLWIILTSYHLMQKLLKEKEEMPSYRFLYLKVRKVAIQTPFGIKNSLGVFVGLNFLKDNELFEKRHLLKAIRRYFPETLEVAGSYFSQLKADEKVKTIYLEVIKKNGKDFSREEMGYLQSQLQNHLSECIESLVRPVFMPRNEEEAMKYIVTLTNQIQSPEDIPQIVIIFDEQTDTDLLFTVIMARPILQETPLLEDIFKKSENGIEVTIDKVKQVHWMRKKIFKEASILRFRLSNTPFLRDDFAVDLYKARQKLVRELRAKLGDVRDYNGGMISKQMEIFFSFKELLYISGEKNEYLLENFFHSLYPSELRVITHLECLKTFYFMFQRLCLDKQRELSYETKAEEKCIYVCAKIISNETKQNILEEVNKMQIPNSQLLKFILPMQEMTFLGFVFFTDSNTQQRFFLESIEEYLKSRVLYN